MAITVGLIAFFPSHEANKVGDKKYEEKEKWTSSSFKKLPLIILVSQN